MLRPFVLAVPLLMLAAAASAADRIVIEHAVSPFAAKNQVRVNVSMTFFVQAPIDDSEASAKAQEHARRLLYESASRECDNLHIIARDCQLESINVNMNRTYGTQVPQGFNATGNFGFQVTLK